jgi:ribonuclease HI
VSPAAKLPHDVVIFTDGASRGNPGPASLGVVITDKTGEVLVEISKKLGDQTNNYAEYMAVIEGLLAAAEGGAKKVVVKADSQLMVRQMLGEYKVKAEGIIPLFKQCQKLVTLFDKIDFIHIPREENAEADRLANKALDGR